MNTYRKIAGTAIKAKRGGYTVYRTNNLVSHWTGTLEKTLELIDWMWSISNE